MWLTALRRRNCTNVFGDDYEQNSQPFLRLNRMLCSKNSLWALNPPTTMSTTRNHDR